MAHSDDATKTWVRALPTKNAAGKVTAWHLEYKYTLAVSGKADFVHTYKWYFEIDNPSKTPGEYTKAELMTLGKSSHWDDMFNKKYAAHIASFTSDTLDTSFDVSTLNDS
tara:strand:- start:54 stop:383 length:330 start_codon:yes stop_codon:yes gene_type:complete